MNRLHENDIIKIVYDPKNFSGNNEVPRKIIMSRDNQLARINRVFHFVLIAHFNYSDGTQTTCFINKEDVVLATETEEFLYLLYGSKALLDEALNKTNDK